MFTAAGAVGAKENADCAPLLAVLAGVVDALDAPGKLNSGFVGSEDLVAAAPLLNTLCVWEGAAPKGEGPEPVLPPNAEGALGVELAPNADEALGFEPAPNADGVLVAPNTDLPGALFCPVVVVVLGKADEVPNADEPPPKPNDDGAEDAGVVVALLPVVAEAGMVGVLNPAKGEGT